MKTRAKTTFVLHHILGTLRPVAKGGKWRGGRRKPSKALSSYSYQFCLFSVVLISLLAFTSGILFHFFPVCSPLLNLLTQFLLFFSSLGTRHIFYCLYYFFLSLRLSPMMSSILSFLSTCQISSLFSTGEAPAEILSC